jgi:hypothetical protein
MTTTTPTTPAMPQKPQDGKTAVNPANPAKTDGAGSSDGKAANPIATDKDKR